MAGRKESLELFRLIKSLTPEEKGYFKKFTGRHSAATQRYLEVFDAISAQSEYNEKALTARFKNYAVTKVYLMDAILESLLAGGVSHNPAMVAVKESVKAKILRDRGLFESAEARLKPLIKDVRQRQDYWLETDVLRTYYWVRKNKMAADVKLQALIDVFAEIDQAFERIHRRDALVKAQNILAVAKDALLLKGQLDIDWQKHIDIDLLKNGYPGEEWSTFVMRHLALADYYDLNSQLPKAHEVSMKLVKQYTLVHQQKLDTFSNPGVLEMAIVLAAVYAIRLHRISEAQKLLHKGWAAASRLPQSGEVYLYYVTADMMMYWYAGKPELGLKAYHQYFTPSIKTNAQKLHTKHFIEIITLKMLLHYIQGNYAQMQICRHELGELSGNAYLTGYDRSYQILHLLIEAETGSLLQVTAKAKNTLRSAAFKKMNADEKEIITAFASCKETQPRKFYSSILKALPAQNNLWLFRKLSIRYWLTAKSKGLTLAEYLEQLKK